MKPVDQPTALPTRKLTAATLAAAIVSLAGLFARNLAPGWYDPETWAALTPIVTLLAGYLIRDLPTGRCLRCPS
jgi:hypothetical protein